MTRYKKKGFTLAEVLIVLGIIGVVAALSAPALIQHANAAKTGPAMAKAISVMTVGFNSYMQLNNADTINFAKASISKDPVKIFEELASGHIKIKKLSGSSPAVYKSVTGASSVKNNQTMFEFPDKSVVIVPSSTCDSATGKVTTVDEEGQTTENIPSTAGCQIYFMPMGYKNKARLMLGEDVFELSYNNNGEVLVYGLDYGTSWTEDCSDEKVANFTPASDKSTCGGRIAAKGFKKDY